MYICTYVCLIVCLFVCLLACLLACLLPCLLACLLACLFVCVKTKYNYIAYTFTQIAWATYKHVVLFMYVNKYVYEYI